MQRVCGEQGARCIVWRRVSRAGRRHYPFQFRPHNPLGAPQRSPGPAASGHVSYSGLEGGNEISECRCDHVRVRRARFCGRGFCGLGTKKCKAVKAVTADVKWIVED